MQRIKKDDIVKVIAGNHKGQKGKVLKILKDKNRVIIEKVNMIKKHQKPGKDSMGGIVETEGSINLSNVMLECPRCQQTSRIGFQILEDGKKVRVCKKCNEIIDK
jgi:large subunit ribosomal protein L24